MLCLCQNGVIRGLAKLTPAVLCLSISAVFLPLRAHASSAPGLPGTPFFALSFVWIGFAVVVLAVVGLALARLARGRRVKAPVQARPSAQPTPVPVPQSKVSLPPAQPPLAASRPKVLEPLPSAQVNLPSAASPQPRRPALPGLPAKTNGKPLKLLNGRHSHRRKIFDYNRYFADLMSTVSGHAGQLEGAGLVIAQPPVTVQQTAAGNGGTHPSNGAFRANSELIASQTAFIEEQRRLIQEQTRVIEEKTKLISEKNQLLKMQTEMLENKLL